MLRVLQTTAKTRNTREVRNRELEAVGVKAQHVRVNTFSGKGDTKTQT